MWRRCLQDSLLGGSAALTLPACASCLCCSAAGVGLPLLHLSHPPPLIPTTPPPPVLLLPLVTAGKIMFIISILGLAVNLSMMKILHQGGHGHSHGGHGHSHGGHGHGAAAASCDDAAAAPKKETNIAVRSAFIHVLGDLLQSVATMIAAIIIWYGNAHGKDWSIADPICTFVFSVLVVFTTVNVVKSALAQLLNSVPSHMSLATIARELVAIPGVANVHDLHVWGFGQNRVALTVHLIADEPAAALVAAQRVAAKHGIAHSTIQTEQCGSRDLANCISYNEHAGACAISLSAAPGGGGGGHGHGGHGHGGGHGHSHGGGHGHSHGGHGHFTAPAPHPHYSGGHSHSSSSCGGSGSSSSSSLDVISRPLPSDVHASGCGAVLSPASPGGGVPAQVPATPAGAVLLPSSPGPTPVLPLSPLGSPAGTVVGSAPAFARLARQDSGGDGDEADLLGLGLGASTL